MALNLQEAMKNANELIEEEERDRKKAEKRRAKKKVQFEIIFMHCVFYYLLYGLHKPCVSCVK